MSLLESGLPLKDEACKDPHWGEYFELYWHAFQVWDVAQVDQKHLGKELIDAADAYRIADRELAEAQKHNHRYLGYRHIPAAASIIRMCLRHPDDGPTLEVVENTVYVSEDPHYTIKRMPLAEVRAGSHPHSGGAPVGNGKELRYNHQGREIEPINGTPFNYLPHADYSGFKQEHEGVWSAAGADSPRLRFGLLGGENLVPFPVLPAAV